MTEITINDLDAIAMGSTILGTGGGGDPYVGKLLTKEAINKYGNVSLIEAHELDDDVLVVCIAAFGAPLILVEKLFSGDEFIKAFNMMEKYLGKKIDAIISAEAGGLNGVIPIGVAAIKNVPLVNGDGMGRAFPRLEMTTFTLHGISSSPITQADEKGNQNVYQTIDNIWAETLVGATTIQMGGSCAVGCYPMSGSQVKKSAVHGIITYSKMLGKSLLESTKNNQNPVETLIKVSNAIPLFSGKISNVTIKIDGRWNKGVCEILGLESYSGTSMQIDFQNEYLMAKKEGKTIAATPDLIIIVDAENGYPITAETIQFGTRVVVLGVKCNEQWRTEEGILLSGPRKFGYDEEYVPIEKLNKL